MPKITAAMMPKLVLSKEDEHELRSLSSDLEREVLRQYEDFLFRRQRQVDRARWKLVKTHEDIHVYSEREDARRAARQVKPFFHESNSSTAMEIGPMASMAANSDLSMLMVTGTMAGQLDDAMYGVSFYDTPSLRTRNAYQKEFMDDNAVLSVIDRPTHEDPCQFLGVIWYLRTYPLAIVSSRDMLLMSHNHYTTLSNGERIAVNLYHSIQHRDLPELKEFATLRAAISLAVVFRQLDDQRVEAFMMEFVDPMGNTPESLQIQVSAKTLAAVSESCNTGFKKKLHTLMRAYQRQRAMSRENMNEALDASSSKHCGICEKSLGKLFSSSGSICQLCSKRVCSKCSVTKRIIIEATTNSTDSKLFDFCIGCTIQAKNEPTLRVAQREVAERRAMRRPHSTSSQHSQSSQSPSGMLV